MNNPLRVLIVEDSEDDALLMVRDLQRGGYAPTFERVETPEAMKASLEKQSWDLIIADYTMSHFGGLAALKMLKGSSLDLPFIIVSGTIGEDVAVEAMKAGAHDYIMKNNLAKLVPAIERELRDALTRRDRKKAEEALKESEEEYRILVDHSLQGIVIAQGPSPHLKFVNPAMSRILGYASDELLSISSKELENLVHPEDREFFFKNFRDRLQGKEAPENYEVRGIRKDGSVCWLSISANRIVFKGGPAIQAAFIDISERKRAEEALDTLLARQEALLAAVPDILMEVDHNKVYTWANQAGFEFFGEDVIGKEAAQYFEGQQHTYSLVQPLFEGDENVFYVESWQRRKDGQKRLLGWWCRVLKDNSGNVTGALSSAQDITERRQAEEAVKESEERYRNLFENAIDGIALADAETGILIDCNKAIGNLVNRGRAELIGQPQKILHPPEDNIGEVSRSFAQHRFDKKGQLLETQVITKTGERKHVEIKANVIELKGGRILQGIFRDITERKQAEQALFDSEQRFRNLIENAPDVIFTLAPDGTVTSLNPAFERITGWPRSEWLHKQFASILHPDDLSRGLELFQRVLKGEKTATFQLRTLSKSGDYLVGEFMVSPQTQSGSVIGILGIARDITERKQAEESLKQSEENARQLAQENAVMAEIGRIISSTLNIDEIYESFSKEAKKLVPFDRVVINMIDTEKGTVRNAYIAGKGLQDRNAKDVYPLEGSGNEEMVRTKSTLLIQTEDFSDYKDCFPMLLSTFQAGFRSIMNVPFFSKGKIIGGLLLRSREPYAYTDKDVRLAERIGSQIAGAIANAQLFTEHLRAEEEKTTLQEQLRQSQKMEAIGRLAGGVAHDFNNLLTIIKGNSELTLMDLKRDDPLRENLEAVLRASGRATDLIRQLLAFSRRQILEMKVIDLNSLLMDLDKMLHRLIGEDIKLVTLPCKDLGRIKADAGQIEQVILNLAVNSRDAMPSGGRLTIETANVELDDEYARRHVAVIRGRYVMLSVSDTGAGMTPEVRDRVFEPFFTTKDSSKGTGLGLSTVYGIVKQSGGNIWVYSEPGKGATFKIYLPRVDEPLGEVVRDRAAEGGIPRGSETILIVEDDDDVREVAVQILRTQGYRVLETSNGSDALQHSEHEAGPIHLMVTDVVMPGMNGPDLAKRLNPLHPEMRVLYVSGYTDDAIVHHGVLEEGVNYIQKPFTVEGLARKVREVLDQ